MTTDARHRPDGEPTVMTPHDKPADRPPLDGPDLWSVPTSGVPVDADRLDIGLLGPWQDQLAVDAQPETAETGVPPTVTPPGQGARPGKDALPDQGQCPTSRQAETHRRYGSSGMALVIAIMVLLGLGAAARWLDSPITSQEGPSGNTLPAPGVITRPRPPSAVPVRPAPRPSGSADVVIGGKPDCPMRIKTKASPSPQQRCFFIG